MLTHPGCEQIGRGPGRFLVRETAQRHTGRVPNRRSHRRSSSDRLSGRVLPASGGANRRVESARRSALCVGAGCDAVGACDGGSTDPRRASSAAVFRAALPGRGRLPDVPTPASARSARAPRPHSSRAPTRNLLASLLIGSVRSTADVTVHQSLGPARTVTLLQTLRMAVADLQQLGGFGQLQFPSFHSAQHFAAPQLLGTHPCPSHSRLLLRSLRVGDISIGRSRGHYHWASTVPAPVLRLEVSPARQRFGSRWLRRGVVGLDVFLPPGSPRGAR